MVGIWHLAPPVESPSNTQCLGSYWTKTRWSASWQSWNHIWCWRNTKRGSHCGGSNTQGVGTVDVGLGRMYQKHASFLRTS